MKYLCTVNSHGGEQERLYNSRQCSLYQIFCITIRIAIQGEVVYR